MLPRRFQVVLVLQGREKARCGAEIRYFSLIREVQIQGNLG